MTEKQETKNPTEKAQKNDGVSLEKRKTLQEYKENLPFYLI